MSSCHDHAQSSGIKGCRTKIIKDEDSQSHFQALLLEQEPKDEIIITKQTWPLRLLLEPCAPEIYEAGSSHLENHPDSSSPERRETYTQYWEANVSPSPLAPAPAVQPLFQRSAGQRFQPCSCLFCLQTGLWPPRTQERIPPILPAPAPSFANAHPYRRNALPRTRFSIITTRRRLSIEQEPIIRYPGEEFDLTALVEEEEPSQDGLERGDGLDRAKQSWRERIRDLTPAYRRLI